MGGWRDGGWGGMSGFGDLGMGVLRLFHIHLSRLRTSYYIYYTNDSNLRVSTYHAYAHPTSIIPTVTFGYPYGSGMVAVW